MDNSLSNIYCSRHSTETTLLYVLCDIIDAIDNGHVGILVLKELTVAFDSTDHTTLLQHLDRSSDVTKFYESDCIIL